VSIHLRQISPGKWYKFGKGRPKKASRKEVLIWLGAQQELSKKLSIEKSPWNRVLDITKWITLLVAAVGFLVLYTERNFVESYYNRMGAHDLAHNLFVNNRTPFLGVPVFVIILGFLLIMVAIGRILAALVKRIMTWIPANNSTKSKIWIMYAISYFIIIAFVVHMLGFISQSLGNKVIYYGISIIICIGLILEFDILKVSQLRPRVMIEN
jgi:hypothetical protein